MGAYLYSRRKFLHKCTLEHIVNKKWNMINIILCDQDYWGFTLEEKGMVGYSYLRSSVTPMCDISSLNLGTKKIYLADLMVRSCPPHIRCSIQTVHCRFWRELQSRTQSSALKPAIFRHIYAFLSQVTRVSLMHYSLLWLSTFPFLASPPSFPSAHGPIKR